ncbi:MAG: hypothetical protein M3Q98_10295 [Actinomycetota bacterium]|nr:hypothetical protein [Actinomycetota bacterium]
MTEPQDPQNLPPYPAAPPPPASPYGAPTYQPGNQPQGDPNARPGTVTSAAWIAIVLSVLGLLGSLGIMAVTSRAVDYVIEHPEEFDAQASDMPAASDLRSVLTVFAAIFIVASVIGILAAFATLKRQGWGRILLVVMSTLAALVSIPFSLGLVGLPWLAGSIAVIVLLFTNHANAWFRGGVQQP